MGLNHRDILLEATSSQKVCENSVSGGDQGASVTQFKMKLKLKFFK